MESLRKTSHAILRGKERNCTNFFKKIEEFCATLEMQRLNMLLEGQKNYLIKNTEFMFLVKNKTFIIRRDTISNTWHLITIMNKKAKYISKSAVNKTIVVDLEKKSIVTSFNHILLQYSDIKLNEIKEVLFN